MSCRTVPYYTPLHGGASEWRKGERSAPECARGFAPFASSAFFLPLFFPLSPPLSLLPWPRDVATEYRDDCFGSSTPRASNHRFQPSRTCTCTLCTLPRAFLFFFFFSLPSIFSFNRIFLFSFFLSFFFLTILRSSTYRVYVERL